MLKLDQESLVKNNYYYHGVHFDTPQSATGEYNTDVCVIGAGFAGLSAALELAKQGFSVIVLEAKTLGFGASGRNGGKALVGYACSNAVLEKYSGLEVARQAWDLTLAGVKLIKERCSEYSIDCDWQDGNLMVATSKSKAEKLEQDFIATNKDYTWPNTRFIPLSELRKEIDSPNYYAGVYDPNGGHFHPVKYLLGLARAARSLGVRIFENSRVNSLTKGEINTLTTNDAVVKAKFVVIAANVYLQDFMPELSKRIMPVGTWMVASAPLSADVTAKLIPSRASVFDTNNALDYFRFTRDNRLLFGGGVSYSTMFPKDLKKALRKNISRVFPQFSEIDLEFAWGGHIDITLFRTPDFGRIGDNVYYLQGFCGHGIALTNIAGKLVAQTIATQINKLDIFANLPKLPFPGIGDNSRRLLLILGMLYYRFLDAIG